MHALKLKRFTKPQVLRRARREVLDEFFACFQRGASAERLQLPPSTLADEDYYTALARCLMGPESLPDALNEALFAIDEMGGAEGRERLEHAIERTGLAISIPDDASDLELALRVWLAAPALLAGEHNQQRMLRLTRFEYWGAASDEDGGASLACIPRIDGLNDLVARLDGWFLRHQRGYQTARVEMHPMEDEFWFLVRHGDTYARTSTVDRGLREILHFRPERDDVIVYSPRHREVRINARTRGERELYRREFGKFIGGHETHFGERSTYTLEPLRRRGRDALDISGIEGIRRVTLRELEVVADNGTGEFSLRGSEDLFACGSGGGEEVIPSWGRLAHAVFEVQFCDSARARPIQVRPPNILKLGRHCDARSTDQWLCRSEIRARC